MAMPPGIRALFQPLGGDLSHSPERTVDLYRLLSLLGAVLVLALGGFYDATSPGAVTVPGIRLAVAGLFVGLFALSHTAEAVRRRVPLLMQGALYVLMGWFAFVAAQNGFAGNFDMGILLLYAILPGVVAIGARRIGPVLWFLGVGFGMGTAAALFGAVPLPKALTVLASLATVALVEGVAIQTHLATEAQLREREERLQGLANSLPGVVFQAYFRPDGSYGSHFVSDHAESILGISADPDDFHERFAAHIPEDHRTAFQASVDAAVDAESAWRQEVPFDTPSGERRWLLCASTPQRHEDELVYNGVILDVTEQKAAERALREERDRFETLFESLPTPVMRCTVEDGTPRIADANGAFEDVFGVDAEQAEGQDANALLLPATNGGTSTRSKAGEIDQRLLDGESLQTEVQRTARDGLRDFQLQATGRTPADGPPEFYAIYTDITEKKEYERKLESLTTRLQLALEATDTGFWEQDLRTDEVFFDEACEQLFGYEPGTFPGTFEAFADRVHPEDRSAVERAMRQAAETGERYQVDFRVQCPDGTQRWVQCRGVVAEHDNGTPRKMIGIQTDITGRKEREQELRRKERRYQAIFQDPNILAGLLAPDGTLLDVNQTAMEYVDASRDDVTGRPFWETPWWNDEMRPVIREKVQRASGGEYVSYEAEHTTPEGTPHNVAGVIRPVTDRTGTVVSLVVSARDVTERKRRARELVAAKEEAEEANRMKSAFLANMSHEIRTPLTSIIGFAEAIGDEIDADATGPVPRFAGLIEESGRALLETLNAVLNLSKLEAGEMQLTPTTVALAPQVDEVAQQLRPQADEATVDLHLDTQSVRARVDEGGLQVVLRNLLSNAIKYTDAGGTVWVRTRTDADTAVLEVEDTGIGMDPEEVPRLFEPFRQASEGTSREYEGTGLGLAVTKQVVTQMDGTIDVETEKGRGTCFTIHLPSADAD